MPINANFVDKPERDNLFLIRNYLIFRPVTFKCSLYLLHWYILFVPFLYIFRLYFIQLLELIVSTSDTKRYYVIFLGNESIY